MLANIPSFLCVFVRVSVRSAVAVLTTSLLITLVSPMTAGCMG